MEVRLEKEGPAIGSPSQTFDHFAADMDDRQADWRRRVSQEKGLPISERRGDRNCLVS